MIGKGENDGMLMQRAEPVPSQQFGSPVRRSSGWVMAARWTTAIVGGYAASAALAALLARLLPIARVEATSWGLIAAFAIYTALLLWCFREPKLGRVAALVWGIALIGGGAAWALGVRA